MEYVINWGAKHPALEPQHAVTIYLLVSPFPLGPNVIVKMKDVQLFIGLYDKITLISIDLFPLPLDFLQINSVLQLCESEETQISGKPIVRCTTEYLMPADSSRTT